MAKRYEKYKDSGIAWISEIPKHWEATNFRYFINILTDYTANGSFGDLSKNVEYIGNRSYARLIRLTDLREDLNNENGVWVNEKAYNYLSKSSLYGGELLLANVGAYSGYSCIMPKVDYPTTLAPNMFLIKQYKKDLNTKYLWYLLSSKMFFNYLQIVALSSAQPKLNKENIRQTPIIIPPIIEQEQIAKYLDWKCGEIDRIVEVRERQIKLLGELRTSVISRAVTHGLTPNAPLKDSGIDWIGQIPKHWETIKLKYIFAFGKGLNITKEDLVESGMPVISYGQIHSKENHGTGVKESLKRFVNGDYLKTNRQSLVNNNDFIFADTSEDLEGVGNCVFVDNNEMLFAGYHTITLKVKNMQHNKYLAYLFLSDLWRTQIRSKVTGVKVFSITKTILNFNTVLLPPIAEQQQIAEYLDKKTAEIDSTINKFKVQIDKLKEYRQALITEVVTGKIDVRCIEIPTPKSN